MSTPPLQPPEDDTRPDVLGAEVPAPNPDCTPRQERIIAGFEEVRRFVAENGRTPTHGADRDIFERLYAVRLDRIRASAECIAILEARDTQGLLAGRGAARARRNGRRRPSRGSRDTGEPA